MATVTVPRFSAFSISSSAADRKRSKISPECVNDMAKQKANNPSTQQLPLKKRFYAETDGAFHAMVVKEETTDSEAIIKPEPVNLSVAQKDNNTSDFNTLASPISSNSAQTGAVAQEANRCMPAGDETYCEPVDFSLPNRSRAKFSPLRKQSPSHTDSESMGESPLSSFSSDSKRLTGIRNSECGRSSDASISADLSVSERNVVLNANSLPSLQLLQALHMAQSQMGSSGVFSGNAMFPFPLMSYAYPGASTFVNHSHLNVGQHLSLQQNCLSPMAFKEQLSQMRPPSTTGFSLSPKTSPQTSSPKNYVINPATGNKVRRNYKNMTRERRMEANARERTRVHTIGAAFDKIQKLIPKLAPDQKMSKLSILRISCKYIMLLGAMTGRDFSLEQNNYSVEDCVEMLNDTIEAEGRLKRFDRN